MLARIVDNEQFNGTGEWSLFLIWIRTKSDKLGAGSPKLDRLSQIPGSEAKDPRSAHDKALDPCQRVKGALGRGLDDPQALTS